LCKKLVSLRLEWKKQLDVLCCFEKLQTPSDIFIGTTIAIPERAQVSFPIELQTDSRK